MECRTAVSIFLYPELVHASERVGLLAFQSIPTVEIAHQMITAEQAAIMLHEPRRKFKTDEAQIVLGEEGFDLRNRQTMLLDVEQEIAALAGAEEIPGLGDAVKRRIQEVLPAAANVFHGRAVASVSDELAAGGNVMPSELTIQSHMHETSRAQERKQRAPACQRIREMMQYPAHLDQIERPIDGA